MNINDFLGQLERATHQALKTGDWSGWKAVQDRHLTYDLKERMTDDQRVRLHELNHGFTLLADPDGSWTDQLSERLEREFRASLERVS
jgi:hypothetical protein